MPTEASVLARLEKLRKRRAKARADEQLIFDQLKDELRAAGEVRINGEPINRSLLIEASGLSRRTAYQVLYTLPDSDTPQPV